MLVDTASMSRNGFLKPIKPSAKPDGPKQPPPNLPNEASRSSLWKQAGIAQKLNYFLASNLMHEASGYLSDPGSVGLLVAALGFQLSKGLRMARVDHPDENWTLAAINRSFDRIVISC